MPERIEDLLKLYRAEVENVTESKVKKVILYGSYARGDFRPDSDIDVMILVDTDRAGVSPLENKWKYCLMSHTTIVMPAWNRYSCFRRTRMQYVMSVIPTERQGTYDPKCRKRWGSDMMPPDIQKELNSNRGIAVRTWATIEFVK